MEAGNAVISQVALAELQAGLLCVQRDHSHSWDCGSHSSEAAPVPAGIPSPRPRGLVSRQSAGAFLLLLVRLFLCHSPYAHIAETLEDTLCPACCLRDLWC